MPFKTVSKTVIHIYFVDGIYLKPCRCSFKCAKICTEVILPLGKLVPSKHPYGSTAHLQNELHHFCVDQSMDRLAVHMGDEVTSTKPRLVGWSTILYMLGLDRTNGE